MSVSCALLGNDKSLNQFNPNEFHELLAKVNRFSIFFDIKIETFPLSVLFKNEGIKIQEMIGKDSLVNEIRNTSEFLNMYFDADHNIIPFLMSFEERDSWDCSLTGLWKRHMAELKSDSLLGEYSSFISDEACLLIYTNFNQYGSLVLAINFCLNKVFYPADIRLMFLNNLLNKRESVIEILKMHYNNFKNIYLRYYETDLETFYLEIVKTFGYLVDPYLESNAIYTIKEPYKSMNAPELIKLQEYLNEK
jgi:hypothetical protein